MAKASKIARFETSQASVESSVLFDDSIWEKHELNPSDFELGLKNARSRLRLDYLAIFRVNTTSASSPITEFMHSASEAGDSIADRIPEAAAKAMSAEPEFYARLQKNLEFKSDRHPVEPFISLLKQEAEVESAYAYNLISQKDDSYFLLSLKIDSAPSNNPEDKALTRVFRSDITRLLRLYIIKEELHSRNKQLEIAIESSNDGFWYINLKKNKMFLSSQWKRMLGYEDHELTNSFSTFENLIHPEERQRVLLQLDPFAHMDGTPFECEYRLRHKSGDYRWILTQAYVKTDNKGAPARFMGTNINITSRVNYRKDLEQKEQEYSNLVNSVHEIIFKTDKHGNFTFLNPAWEQVTGFSYKQTIGTNSEGYIFPDDRELNNSVLFEAETENQPKTNVDYEIRFLNSSGGYTWMHVYATVEYDRLGRFAGLYGTLIDIHKRKMAELAQHQSEERFRVMSDTMSDLVTMHRVNGTMYYLSPSVEDMLGFAPEELIGKRPHDLVHPQDLIQLQSNLIDPLMTGELQKLTGQMRFRKKDGSYIWVESIIQPLMKDGLMDSILSVSRDVSEWKNAEFEMSKALEKEKDLNELKSRFITMASHEFRTPLTSIKSSVQLLEMYADEVGSDLSQPLYKHMAKISTQIDRLTDLMEDILIVGKTEADKMPFEEEPTDLVEFTESILETELPVNEVNRSAKLTIHGDPYNVKIDQGLMGHVLSNTLSNAFKYSPGAAPPEVDLFFESNYFEITVTDFGMGIPQEQRHQLFESFFRADNAVDIQGTGLGLVITKQFVELHGGTIRIESQLNQGTKVIMRFPLSR